MGLPNQEKRDSRTNKPDGSPEKQTIHNPSAANMLRPVCYVAECGAVLCLPWCG